MRTYVAASGRCPLGKVRYRDEIAAKLVLAAADAADDERRRERRAYPCERCRGWHVTSQERKTG